MFWPITRKLNLEGTDETS